MRDPFSNNSHYPPPLPPEPEENDPEIIPMKQELPKLLHPNTGKVLQRLFIGLLAIGLIIGGVMAVGVITLMNKAGLFGVPPIENKSK